MQKKKRRKKPKGSSGAWKPADGYIYIYKYIFFCVFSENKIAFHLLITASKVPPKGTGLISQGLRGRNPHYCFSTNEFSAALCLPPVHPLGCYRQQANLCLSLFFSLPTWAKGSAASTSSRRIVHHLNEDMCRWAVPAFGDSGQVVFFFADTSTAV